MILKNYFCPNIIHQNEIYPIECKYEINVDLESDFSDNNKSDDGNYNFKELEIIKT